MEENQAMAISAQLGRWSLIMFPHGILISN